MHKQNFPEEEVPSASDIFKNAPTFNDAFSIFALAQQLVSIPLYLHLVPGFFMTLTNMIYNTVITYYLKVDHPDAVKLAAKNVLNEFCEENVAYVELRSTPRTCPGLSFASIG